MTDNELLSEIEAQRAVMVAVSTGGPAIEEKQPEYIERRLKIFGGLRARRIDDPNPHRDLWAWYGKWSSGDLPTYQSRRQYLSDLYGPLIDNISAGTADQGVELFDEPTGWALVDRKVDVIRQQFETAENEEDFQVVGLFCRETLISLAQAVFDPEMHPPSDGTNPSNTDAYRMLEGYLSAELRGGSHEETRRFAKAALGLANFLQHNRSANFRDAAICAQATTSVVNVIAIISGRRDP